MHCECLRWLKRGIEGLETRWTYTGLKELEQARLAVVVQHQDSLNHSVSSAFKSDREVGQAIRGGLRPAKGRMSKGKKEEEKKSGKVGTMRKVGGDVPFSLIDFEWPI